MSIVLTDFARARLFPRDRAHHRHPGLHAASSSSSIQD
jgi:hypothetical protein